MWFANLAQVNPGIVTVIWALGPLYMALAEICILGKGLKPFHWVGTILIIICAILIALSGVVKPPEEEGNLVEKEEALLGAWAPVLLAIITPIWFTTSGLLVKVMGGERAQG